MFTTFDKAIAAFIVPVLIGLLEMIGITPSMTVAEMVDFVVIGITSAIAVYFASNKTK